MPGGLRLGRGIIDKPTMLYTLVSSFIFSILVHYINILGVNYSTCWRLQ